MTKRRYLLPLAVFLLVGIAKPAMSDAFYGWPNGSLGACGYGYCGSPYTLGSMPVPPYFALHPPVYYGERYFRSYGGSPFARRGSSAQTRTIVTQVVLNPYVTGSAAKQAQPEIIINPFYKPDTEEPEATEPPPAE